MGATIDFFFSSSFLPLRSSYLSVLSFSFDSVIVQLIGRKRPAFWPFFHSNAWLQISLELFSKNRLDMYGYWYVLQTDAFFEDG